MSEPEEPEDCLLFIPSQEMDIQQYFQFLFSSTKEELDELMEEYPLVEQKYLLLQDAIQQQLDIDIFSFFNENSTRKIPKPKSFFCSAFHLLNF